MTDMERTYREFIGFLLSLDENEFQKLTGEEPELNLLRSRKHIKEMSQFVNGAYIFKNGKHVMFPAFLEDDTYTAVFEVIDIDGEIYAPALKNEPAIGDRVFAYVGMIKDRNIFYAAGFPASPNIVQIQWDGSPLHKALLKDGHIFSDWNLGMRTMDAINTQFLTKKEEKTNEAIL